MSLRVFILALAMLFVAGLGGTLLAQRLSSERIVLYTSTGDVVLALYPDIAPRHVAQLLRLVRLGVYSRTKFAIVDASFLAQLADARDRSTPLSPEQESAIEPLSRELSDVPCRRGTVVMSPGDRDGDAETSFAILLADSPHLDGQFTVVGKVERGFDVLDAMAVADKDLEFHPLLPIEILRAEIVESVEALSRLKLSGPVPQPSRLPLVGSQGWVVWALAAMVSCGLTIGLLGGRVPLRAVRSLGLLSVLIGSFSLFVLLSSQRGAHPWWIGVIVFMGSMMLFRVMRLMEE